MNGKGTDKKKGKASSPQKKVSADGEYYVTPDFKAHATLPYWQLALRFLYFLWYNATSQTIMFLGFLLVDIDKMLAFCYTPSLLWHNLRYYRVRGSPPIKYVNLAPSSSSSSSSSSEPKHMLYLPNHRSWGDFIVDPAVLGFRNTFLSRFAVALVLPATYPMGSLSGAAYFFVRGKGKRPGPGASEEEKKAASEARIARSNAIMDAAYALPWKAVAAYPEGTRLRGDEPGKLRTGALRHAFSRGIPCQAVISTNKEKVIDEVTLTLRRNCNIITAVGEVIDPATFLAKETKGKAGKEDAKARERAEEAFLEAVTKSFAETWKKANSATLADCEEYDMMRKTLSDEERRAVLALPKAKKARMVAFAGYAVLLALLLARPALVIKLALALLSSATILMMVTPSGVEE